MKRVAIFASVSTPQQAAIEKDSLPSQIKAGRLFAESIGGQVVATYRVPGHSRKYIFYQEAEQQIPAYAELRQACDSNSFDVLWCRSRDRLGRTDALIAQVEALVQNAGAAVYSAAMPTPLEDTSEASALFLSAIERAGAQVENVTKRRRHRIGMHARVKRGLPGGRWPYGYRAVRNDKGATVGGELVESQAKVVRQMTRLFLDGLGLEAISDRLNENGAKPPVAERWAPTMVRDILYRDTYAGHIKYGDLIISEKSDRFPAIWDEATYRAVQRERSRRHRGGKPAVSPLSGAVVCARCGWKMTVSTSKGHRYFRCNKHLKRRWYGECHWNYTKETAILEFLGEQLSEQIDSSEVARLAVNAQAPDTSQLEEEAERAAAEVEAIQQKRTRLGLMVSEGQMLADVYRRADDALIGDLEVALQHLEDARGQLAALPSPQDIEDRVTELSAFLEKEGWQGLLSQSPARMRALLHRWGLVVRCADNAPVDLLLAP